MTAKGSALAIIRLTYRSTEKVKEDQKALRERLGEVGSENVVVFFDSLPIYELESLLGRVRENHLTVAGEDLTLESRGSDLLSERVLEYSNLSQNDPDMLYPYYEVMLLSESEPRRLVKTDGVTFGEPIPSDVAHRSLEEAWKCDLMLICGTSAVVYPFAQLPRIARQRKTETESKTEAGLYAVEEVPVKCRANAFNRGKDF